MKISTKGKEHFKELLRVVLSLKKELESAYLALDSNLDPAHSIRFFDGNRKVLNELVQRLESFGEIYSTNEDGIKADEETDDLKKQIKAEILEIADINSAFSGLVKKNMYYNQLTISFITDIFKKNSVYDKSGENSSSFSPLKNVLMGSGLKI